MRSANFEMPTFLSTGNLNNCRGGKLQLSKAKVTLRCNNHLHQYFRCSPASSWRPVSYMDTAPGSSRAPAGPVPPCPAMLPARSGTFTGTPSGLRALLLHRARPEPCRYQLRHICHDVITPCSTKIYCCWIIVATPVWSIQCSDHARVAQKDCAVLAVRRHSSKAKPHKIFMDHPWFQGIHNSETHFNLVAS